MCRAAAAVGCRSVHPPSPGGRGVFTADSCLPVPGLTVFCGSSARQTVSSHLCSPSPGRRGTHTPELIWQRQPPPPGGAVKRRRRKVPVGSGCELSAAGTGPREAPGCRCRRQTGRAVSGADSGWPPKAWKRRFWGRPAGSSRNRAREACLPVLHGFWGLRRRNAASPARSGLRGNNSSEKGNVQSFFVKM